MRYGLAELFLVQPGAFVYRPPPDLEAPGVRAAIALARRHAAAAREPRFDTAEMERLMAIPGVAHLYASVRHPEGLSAPPPWPQELLLMSATALLAALGRNLTSWRTGLLWGPPYVAAAGGVGWLRLRAERRAARRLGLTPLTAPQRTISGHLAVLAAAGVVHGLLRLTGRAGRPRQPAWTLYAAQDIIRRLEERRSWRRAYAAAGARSAQARSSAESRTSGGWAPDTP
jgi:DNA-binding transcriptional ArsR family regulator